MANHHIWRQKFSIDFRFQITSNNFRHLERRHKCLQNQKRTNSEKIWAKIWPTFLKFKFLIFDASFEILYDFYQENAIYSIFWNHRNNSFQRSISMAIVLNLNVWGKNVTKVLWIFQNVCETSLLSVQVISKLATMSFSNTTSLKIQRSIFLSLGNFTKIEIWHESRFKSPPPNPFSLKPWLHHWCYWWTI